MSEFISEAWEIINKAHEQFDTERAVTWKGKNGHISLSAVPNNHRVAVRNLIDQNDPTPGHDRGAHATNPSTGAAGTYREFDLTAGRDGRATRLNRNGRRAIYYSNTHAFGTYKYALVTDAHGRPLLRPGAVASRAAPPEVPLP